MIDLPQGPHADRRNPAGRKGGIGPLVYERHATELREGLAKFQAGVWDDRRWTAFRLRYGIYGQLQSGAQMVRIKVPDGIVTFATARGVAAVSRHFAKGKIHLTTRREFQVYQVPTEAVADLYQAMADAELTAHGQPHALRQRPWAKTALRDVQILLETPQDMVDRCNGFTSVVVTPPSGLVSSGQLETLVSVAERHGGRVLRLTREQGIAVPGLPTGDVRGVIDEFASVGLSAWPHPATRRAAGQRQHWFRETDSFGSSARRGRAPASSPQ